VPVCRHRTTKSKVCASLQNGAGLVRYLGSMTSTKKQTESSYKFFTLLKAVRIDTQIHDLESCVFILVSALLPTRDNVYSKKSPTIQRRLAIG
jgi:hypothetical protein